MLRQKKNAMLGQLIFWAALLAGFVLSLPSALAVNYTVIAGSTVIISSTSGQIPGYAFYAFLSVGDDFYNRPYMGGFSLPNSSQQLACAPAEMVKTVDGRKGVQINNHGIIAGLTGIISGAVATVSNSDNLSESTTFTGGLVFNTNGFATPFGNATAEAADILCAGARMPYNRMRLSSAGNDEIGNKLADFTGDLWIYVPRSIPPGTYSMEEVGISQGASYGSPWNGYLAITQPGDTMTVLPPPCTIATDTAITFDVNSPAGRRVSAPITYQCGDVAETTVLDAYLLANAVGKIDSTTELALSSAGGSQPGGVVRGYVSAGVSEDSAGCMDTANSLSFDGAFNNRLAPVSTGLAVQIPLVWQLCLKGDEQPGVATGSVLLDIGYK